MQVIEKYRLNFAINEEADVTQLTQYEQNIERFINFLKKAIPSM